MIISGSTFIGDIYSHFHQLYPYIHKTGVIVIAAEYIDASDFTKDGAAKVQIAKKKGAYIDTTGNIICAYKL